jgi:hypothetical protein
MTSLCLRGTAALVAMGASAPALADHGVAGGGVSGSGPIVTLAAETLPAGKLAAGVSARFTRPDAYADSELIALAAQHVHAHTTDGNLAVTGSLAYGVTGHLMLAASLPYVRRDHLREGQHSHSGGAVSNTVEELGTVSDFGDLSLSAQYVLAHDHQQAWFVSLLAGVKVPTGSTHETDLSGARLETEHQPGTGSWDALFGLAASKSWGRWSAHASGLYQLSTEGAQATRLGDRMNLSAAVVVNLTPGHADGEEAEHYEHRDPASWAAILEASYEWEGRQQIGGVAEADSGAKVVWLSPGLRFTSPAGWSAGLSAGLPLWQDVRPSHPDNAFRLIAQLGTAF